MNLTKHQEKELSDVVNADVLIFCIGYDLKFPYFAEKPQLVPIEMQDGEPYMPLYHYTMHPSIPSLFFIGMVEAQGGMYLYTMGEMQARWAAGVVADQVPVPSNEKIEGQLQSREEYWGTHQIPGKFRMYVPYVTFMDELGDDLQCSPLQTENVAEIDENLREKLQMGPVVPSQYRLAGPGKWEGAKSRVEETVSLDSIHHIAQRLSSQKSKL